MDLNKNEVIELFVKKIRTEIYNLMPADDFIESLRQDLYDFYEENPELTEEDLVLEFGTPEKIATDFLEGSDVVKPKVIAKSKMKRNFVIIGLLIVLIATGVVLIDTLSHKQVMATDVIVIHD